MVDTDGFIYSRKKPKDTPLYSAWRCRKHNPPMKCPCHAYLTLSLTDNSLTLGSKPHNHPADHAAPPVQREDEEECPSPSLLYSPEPHYTGRIQ